MRKFKLNDKIQKTNLLWLEHQPKEILETGKNYLKDENSSKNDYKVSFPLNVVEDVHWFISGLDFHITNMILKYI